MLIAHLGIGLLILGITGSSIWQEEKITRLQIDTSAQINKYNIIFKEINEVKGPNYVAIKGNFTVYDEKENIITKLEPENRYYPITNTFTTEASLLPFAEIVSPITELSYCSQIHLLLDILGFSNILAKISSTVWLIFNSFILMIFSF